MKVDDLFFLLANSPALKPIVTSTPAMMWRSFTPCGRSLFSFFTGSTFHTYCLVRLRPVVMSCVRQRCLHPQNPNNGIVDFSMALPTDNHRTSIIHMWLPQQYKTAGEPRSAIIVHAADLHLKRIRICASSI